MKVTVRVSKNFKKEAKPLLKKHQTLAKDLLRLEKELTIQPRLGRPLGNDCYKIRLRITSKGMGKSRGARVITKVDSDLIGLARVQHGEEITVSLLSIYDKSEIANISDKELKELIKMHGE